MSKIFEADEDDELGSWLRVDDRGRTVRILAGNAWTPEERDLNESEVAALSDSLTEWLKRRKERG